MSLGTSIATSTGGCRRWLQASTQGSTGSRHDPPLPLLAAERLLPVFERLSHPELLERCSLLGTSIANEHLDSVVWRRAPKTVFTTRNCRDWRRTWSRPVQLWRTGPRPSGHGKGDRERWRDGERERLREGERERERGREREREAHYGMQCMRNTVEQQAVRLAFHRRANDLIIVNVMATMTNWKMSLTNLDIKCLVKSHLNRKGINDARFTNNLPGKIG